MKPSQLIAEDDDQKDVNLLENEFDIRLNKKLLGSTRLQSTIPRKRSDIIRWDGWGYQDTRFVVRDGPLVAFTGGRYSLGEVDLPLFTQWVIDTFDVELSHKNESAQLPQPHEYPEAHSPQEFLDGMGKARISWSTQGEDRLVRCHGQTFQEMYKLRFGLKKSFPRIPDIVVWPENHEHVVKLTEYAEKLGMVIIPYGGGTSVSGAVTCLDDETRPIISLDTTQMNQILWLDEKNLLICCQCGIVGQDLEKFLRTKGYTVGHEPDSYEFSTIGGWVATRASGMKKNTYGNIEDLLMSTKMVTPRGTLERRGVTPRQSIGPDFNQLALGSEGTLGVVTEVVLKIRPLPELQKYGSIIFPTFADGIDCMREIAKQRCQPASIRLMDNEQFRLGQALSPPGGYLSYFSDTFKKAYLSIVRGFDLGEICVTTLLFEGSKKDVEKQESKIYEIAHEYYGLPAGEENGERGYTLTFLIGYVRDIALEYNVVAESMETSVHWSNVLNLCRNVKCVLETECEKRKITHRFISHRVTQTYDAGCCVYFYFGFNWLGVDNPVSVYEEIEIAAREEILANGGSLSHHHGVGKSNIRWYRSQVSELGESLFRQAKRTLDPNNVFAAGNIIKGNVEASNSKL